jgi:hypothetical protein
MIGSGHCLQSRISHEHALDGYESRIVDRTVAAAIDSRPPTARCGPERPAAVVIARSIGRGVPHADP